MNRTREEQGDVVNTVDGDIYGGTVIQGRNIHVDHHEVHEVSWPVRVGVIPEQASHYQHRTVADRLHTALNNFGTGALRQVLSGSGGVGKTQLAAHYARTLAHNDTAGQRIDVLVWANASSREQITSAYAQAAQQLYATTPNSHEDTAQLFLTWLQDPSKHQNRRWLIVWDDLADPAAVRDLWPPHDQPHGRVLATTRRRDHQLTDQNGQLINVDVYTEDEASAFLTQTLDTTGIAHTHEQLEALARSLGRLPLALGQAVTYMAELNMGCDDYLQVFHDRINTLSKVFPDWDRPTPVAATWELSLTRADSFNPKGAARPLMGLIALLDGTSIPEQVLTALPVLEYLADQYTKKGSTAAAFSPHQARATLANLVRLNLITRTAGTEKGTPGQALVGAHQLVQRATREHTTTRPDQRSVYALADALIEVWPKIERDPVLAQRLRSNTTALRFHHAVEGRTSEDWLWEPGGHKLLFRTGESLDECGRTQEAIAYWEQMVEQAQHHLGLDHPNTLTTRNNLAAVRGKFGDATGAAIAYERLLQDERRILGPGHLQTPTRANLAYMRGEAGDPIGAVTAYEVILQDLQRVLGPDHPDTLTTRNNLAHMRGRAGDISGAAQAFEALLQDRIRALGPDHPDTLNSRHNLAEWRGHNGDAQGATAACEDLLDDQLRILGSDHPVTLRTRQSIAEWRGKSGDALGAIDGYKNLLDDRIRVIGPNHPHTLDTHHNLANWRGQAGDPIGAITTFEHLLQNQIRLLGSNHPDTLTTRCHIAAWNYGLGNINTAMKIMSETKRDQERELGYNHPDTQMSIEVIQLWREKIDADRIFSEDL